MRNEEMRLSFLTPGFPHSPFLIPHSYSLSRFSRPTTTFHSSNSYCTTPAW